MKHLLRTRTFLRPYYRHILTTLLLLVVMTGLNLLVPRIIQNVVDSGLSRGDMRQILQSALILLSLGFGSAVLTLIHRYLTEWVAGHLGGVVRGGEELERGGARVVVRKVRRQQVQEAQVTRA